MDESQMLEARINEPLSRSPFYFRPLCLFSAVFAILNAAIMVLGYVSITVALVLWLCYAAFHFIRRKTFALFMPWILLAAVIASVVTACSYTEHRKPIIAIASENTALAERDTASPKYKLSKIKAEVTSVYYCESFGSAYRVKLISVDGKKAYGHASLECPQPLNAVPYDTVYCDGIFFRYETGSGRDASYARSNDIVARIETDTAAVRYEGNSGISRAAYELRERISFNLHRACDSSSAASFAMAVVFGVRDGMDQALERDCSAIGIIHLLAVSGSHFSTLIAALAFLLRRTYVPGPVRQLYFAAFAIAFTIMCGGTSAIMRAALMTVFCMLVRFFGYRPDPFIALFVSLAALSIFRPYCVFDIGFLLSFFSTFGILLQIDRLIIPNKKEKRSIKLINAIWGAFKVTLFATLFSFPILAAAYGSISFVGLIANLVAGPVITVAMFAAIILMVSCNIPIIGPVSADLFELIYETIKRFSNLLALNTDTSIQLRAPYVPYLIIIPLCLFLLLRLLSINENLLTYIPLALSIFSLTVASFIHSGAMLGTSDVALVSFKSNECLVLRSDNSAIICDLSDGTRAVSEKALETVFEDFYSVDIDGYMITHYHVRHISTLGKIIRNHYLRTVFLPEPFTDDEKSIARSIEKLTENYGGEVIYYVSGESFNAYGTDITALRADHTSSTHPTVAVKITRNDSSITYLGAGFSDSTAATEMLALSLGSDTVILGAHGPKQYESEFFIHTSGQKIYVSPACAYLPREGIDTKLTADKKGNCKAFWSFEPSAQP